MEDELQETHFAALLIGTGLTQSIAAAALAAASQPVIHIDENPTYGGEHASLSLSELVEWAKTAPDAAIEVDPALLAASRQYSISLVPHLIPATGRFVAALVNSGVARYGSFVLLKRVAVAASRDGTIGFRSVPASKQDVFRDRGISLVQKRRLIKFLMFASGEFESAAELVEREETPLLQFLQDTFSLSTDLAEALAYAVAFCTSPNDPTLPALLRTRAYLRSTGRYGPSPFLIGHYGGAGELAQGFCRTCAVRGGTYVLGRKILSITRDEAVVKTPSPVETMHGVHRKDLPVYHPPSTFEGYGVEGVEVGQAQTEGQGEGKSHTEGEQPPARPSTAPESAPTPHGPVFRIQLEGFAAPFTTSKIVGPEDCLPQNLGRKNASGQDDKAKDEEGVSGMSSGTNNLATTVRGILVIDSPRSFRLGDVNPIIATSTTSARDDSAGDAEGEAEPPTPAAVDLDETLLVFPPSCGLGSEGSVTMLGNGSSTMSCPDGKCILYFTAQTSSRSTSPKSHLEPYVHAVLAACTPRPMIHVELYYREREPARLVVHHANVDEAGEAVTAMEYATMHMTEGADAAAGEAERVFWEVVGEGAGGGEGAEGEEAMEFFAGLGGEDEGLDDF